MLDIILVLSTAFLIAIFAVPSIITVAKLKGLYDKPNNRKVHTSKTPRLGGLAIFMAFSLAILMWGSFTEINGIQYFAAALIVLFFSGLKDDIIILSPIKKLFIQIFAATIVATMTDIRITNFQGILGVYEIPMWVSIAMTIFTLIVITNAFNLIDGVDGLAGGLGFIISLTFAVWFFLIDKQDWSLLAFSVAGSILGFLFFNFNPAKIFMGDAGSLTLGFLISAFAIQFIEYNSPAANNISKINSAPSFAVAVLIVPLYDTLRIFILRLISKKSPFKADRNHIHHWLIKIGLNHKEVCFTLWSINIAFILIALAIKDNSAFIVMSIVIVLALAVGQLPVYFYRHKLANIDVDEAKLFERDIEILTNEYKN